MSNSSRLQEAAVLTFDVGGTKISAALASQNNEILARLEEPTRTSSSNALIEQLRDMSVKLQAQTVTEAGYCCIGLPGSVHPGTGRIRNAPNLPDFADSDLRSLFRQCIGTEVVLDNDVNLAALGEFAGRAGTIRSLAFVAYGTGVGLGFVEDGRILQGAHGAACEIALLPLGSDPFDARYQREGPFETAVGSHAILARYNTGRMKIAASVKELIDTALSGDADSYELLCEVCRSVAQGLTAVVALLDPEIIVFGGSIGIRPQIPLLISKYLRQCLPSAPRCEISVLGGDAAIRGGIVKANSTLNAAAQSPTLQGRLKRR